MSEAPFDLVDEREGFADGDWFYSCAQTQTPYVVVRSGETSADVLWDYVTLPLGCDTALRRDFQHLEQEARAIFARYATEASYLRVKPTLICFDHLPVDGAKKAAGELYRLIARYLPQSQAAESQAAATVLGQPAPATATRAAAPRPLRPVPRTERAKRQPAKRALWIESFQGSESDVA